MTKEKLNYVSPETNILVIRFEASVLTTSGGTEEGNIITTDEWD